MHCTDPQQIKFKILNRLPTNNDNKHEGNYFRYHKYVFVKNHIRVTFSIIIRKNNILITVQNPLYHKNWRNKQNV